MRYLERENILGKSRVWNREGSQEEATGEVRWNTVRDRRETEDKGE